MIAVHTRNIPVVAFERRNMHRYPTIFYLSVSLFASSLWGQELPPASAKKIDYDAHIAPLLAEKCLDCHGTEVQEGRFRLDRKSSVLRGGDSGEPGLIVGNSADSHLIKLVAGLDAAKRMPPDTSEQLTPEEIGLLRAWIDQGVTWPGPDGIVTTERINTSHWAFQPVAEVVPPPLPKDWGHNPIDAFVLRKLSERELAPSPPAGRETLIRRIFLDVLGLPPSPDRVARYLAAEEPRATLELIEEVLASPHYGERWARHWLDLVRFAETHGFETNRERPHAWRYRDYVIDSLNSDKPYDQFIREQIAGDLHGNPVGLGYLVAGPYDQVKSPDINLTLMQRHNELDDMINTTGTTFLGLTLGCARCHNHKFDPLTQTDYYALEAIFSGVNHADMPLPLPREQQERVAELDQRIGQLRVELNRFHPPAREGQLLLIDDDPSVAGSYVEQLQSPAGAGVNPPGTERGHQQDAGSPERTRNLGGGKYTWWKNAEGQPVARWNPQLSGRYRLWISWGCGFETHSRDARYVLDRDGDANTREDWEEIHRIDQRHFADGTAVPAAKPLWSGFAPGRLVTLDARSSLLLVGGATGTALTADVVLFESLPVDEEVAEATQPPPLRDAVQATGNLETFPAHAARAVRFVIEATNSSQPCLDELEIFSGEQNVALASQGGKATASGTLQGYPIHKLEHINDGRPGNSHSWISNETGKGWVQIDFANEYVIDRISWARDREGKYADRLATQYRIESSLDGATWKTIASSQDRLPATSAGQAVGAPYRFDHLSPEEATRGKELLQQLNAAESLRKQLAEPPQAYAGRYSQPGPTYRLYRGEPLAKREQVAPNVPALFADLKLAEDTPEQERRRALADWIASPENPLTARVMVNRIWQFHFGQGLVTTPSDFGAGGVPPTHPELLDWLARQLITHDWSLKHIHRLILQSATYRQASVPREAALRVDGATQFWWRYPPHRLEAEPIRDSILAVTGVLDLRGGGSGFSAFEVEAENVRHYHPKSSFGPDDWRRMIYMTKVRMEQDAVFGLFDCPDAASSVSKRTTSTTPLQALNLFNSEFLLQQAEIFATRLKREFPEDEQAQLQQAYRLCYAREPAPEELQSAHAFVRAESLMAFCRALLNSNEFLFLQ